MFALNIPKQQTKYCEHWYEVRVYLNFAFDKWFASKEENGMVKIYESKSSYQNNGKVIAFYKIIESEICH